MNPFAIILLMACGFAILSVRREWALVPLLVGCTYMTMGQGIELGPISLPVYRMLLLIGLCRVIVKGEAIEGKLNTIDRMMILWSVWVVFASFFHDPTRAGPIFACGVVFNMTLIYFLVRVWCRDVGELTHVIKILALLLVPIAGEMLLEKFTGKNLFSVFGGVPENTLIREGKLRAQGPFRHPILAGTVGATCIPLFIGIWRKHRMQAVIGVAAGFVMVIASASSGPVMSLAAGCFALVMWKFRHLTKLALIGAAGMYLLLEVTMKQPPYYLIARIDISGGSTGWHRAHLIEQTFAHFSEWWLFGTDATRHWMPEQGIAKDPMHTDITNYYIGFGVFGGFLSMMLVIGMLAVAFKWVGHVRKRFEEEDNAVPAFTIWCYGASLFSHVVTGVSVAYFDQSMIFFWQAVAVISSIHSVLLAGYHVPRAVANDDPIDLEMDEALANARWRMEFRNRPARRSLENILEDLPGQPSSAKKP